MSIYPDTSVMMALHLHDANFPQAQALMQTAHGKILWTPWQKVEFGNATRALIARGKLTVADVRNIEAAIRAMVTNGDILPRPLPAYALWQQAETLSRAHTPSTGLRTLDLLHIAAATVLKAARFWTFDIRQHTVARAAGLSIS
ncbi:hypothetical protein OPIT5_18185 [Opitutaceae bacterium TAV5]|nr:hypothetical protein OPIT5_18185 [Opitutaceae bacterium TAV5]